MGNQVPLSNGGSRRITLPAGQAVTVSLLSGIGEYSANQGVNAVESRTLTSPCSIGVGPYSSTTTVTILAGPASQMLYETGVLLNPAPVPFQSADAVSAVNTS